ncbi:MULTISPECIES: OmpA family protein [Methylobacterium]|uniref:Peptidoglycan-associated lipoprotein n=1 Tax=Methylobacterium jeotgali TaxID=381630 RepID=A0ABQ4SYK5_9HYPH|nr:MULTISPECIES: OmpA family protein [Methylobacterium]PIU04182.1 MAG: flagellar motor protein MotB [Methylobacterium sp. CG09_land_8_20_14_0_10_71_15]PIU15069.1 MAG: flagellar motor protein MotB [Methylobacterium sp. CG08_land_8_20_14_0_20_71_15]GBU17884.1 flagellar motor protein MotB [Methylobacterium sp.]GJE07306.1 Peptidoglycan-associated lipoprotein [Methylobacterium jeotgali]
MTSAIRYCAQLVTPAILGAASGALLLAGAALADPAYRAADIVAHFTPGAAPPKSLGRPRALCIGTETECAKDVPEPARTVDGFDLRVNFDYNSARLTPAARTNLDEFARALRDPALAGARFLVEGHTDGAGSDSFNLDLSMRRAGAVVDYLTHSGVPGARLEAMGYGKQKPLVPDPMASENRRVETRLRAP